MKKLIALIIIVLLGIWGYRSCTHKKAEGQVETVEETKVLKQVKVTATYANLRTGPGTNYDYATVSADGSGGKWKVKRGTVLEVISETGDWYEVRPVGNTRTAYIKKSLCANLDQTKDKKKDKKKRSVSNGNSTEDQIEDVYGNLPDDGVEEVTNGHPQDDDVIF
jgi:uncharacterized protein YgiM (DUF1202 family)